MLSLRAIRYALAAADHQSVTAAASALNVSQPSVSAAIAQIEADYGEALFVRRKGQGVSLTPFGRLFVARSRRLIEDARELAALNAHEGTVSGEVTLGVFADLAPRHAPAILTAFEAAHPSVRVHFREGDLEELPRLLERAEADLMLSYDIGLPASLGHVTVAVRTPYALVPRDHPFAKRKHLSLKDVATGPLIIADQPASRRYFIDLFNRHGLRPEMSRLSGSFETVRGFVAAGLGLSIAFTRPIVDVSYDGSPFVTIPVRGVEPEHRIVLVWPSEFRLTRASLALKDFIAAWFAEHG
ncbi:MAG: LysR family transcriptional regulator [Rhizobiales bacterium]|nr:LysR family transcriptional regulator [Hyphomicrobiales bacterium]